MSEPQLTNFLILLEDPGFKTSRLDKEDTLREVLCYLRSEQNRSVIEALKKKNPAERQNIIRNLAALYPLSRNLVEAVLKEFAQSDQYLCEGFGFHKDLIKNLSNILDSMKGKIGTTNFFNECKNKVRDLEKKAEEQQPKFDEVRAMLKRRDELDEELERGRDAQEIKRLEEENAALESKIAGLVDKKRTLAKKLEENRAREKRMLDELAALKDVGSGEQKELWNRLAATFPSDAEEK